MDRENTPLKQRQKRGGGSGNRRSSTSSTGSSASAATNQSRGSQQSAASVPASGSGATNAGGAAARAFRGSSSTRTRAKTASTSSTSTNAVGSAPAMILAKHPPPQPTILRASMPPTAAMPGLCIPDTPASTTTMRSNPSATANSRFSDSTASYLHVNTQNLHVNTQNLHVNTQNLHVNTQNRHSTGSTTDGPVRTLYQPPPSSTTASSPSVKKFAPSPQSATGQSGPSTLLRSLTPSAIAAPATSVKLVSAQLQFATDLSTKLAGCLELTNFTVVGALGLDGVGKSTLLSLLHRPVESYEPLPMTSSTNIDVFKTQSVATLLANGHETSGVDVAVHTDPAGSGPNLVLLDTEPMLSSAMLAEHLSRAGDASLPPSSRYSSAGAAAALPLDQQLETRAYQLAAFVLSVCHYVVVAHDGLADLEVVRLLQRVEARLQRGRALPHISGSTGTKDKHVAKLLFVATRVPTAMLCDREALLLARHVRALEFAWPGAFYRTARPVSFFSEPNQQPEQHIPVFVLPPKASAAVASRTNSSRYEDYDAAAARWQRFVHRLPSAPSFSKNVATTPHHAMSLREWLSNASRVFDAVRKSSAFTAESLQPLREAAAARDHH